MKRKRPSVILVLSLALAAVGPGATAADAADEPCTPNGPLSGAYLNEDTPAGKSRPDASYETSVSQRTQRTLYLPGGAYVVSVCGPGDDVTEQISARMPLANGGTQYRVVSSAERKDGRWRAFFPLLPNPVDAVAKLASAKLTARWNEVLGAAAQRAAQGTDGRVQPGDPQRLTTYTPPRSRARRFTPRWLGNKCIHNSWGRTYPFLWRHYSYYTALGGGSWQRTRFGDAVGTWTGAFNNCGFNQGYQRVFADWLGDIQDFFPYADGTSQVGYWWGWDNNYCGSTLAIGCTLVQRYDWDGQQWTVSEADVWFHYYYPWSVDGSCSGGSTVDFWGVMAHEIGHVYGAIDLPEGLDYYAQDMVMAQPADWCTTQNRYLGYGDFQFLVNTYP